MHNTKKFKKSVLDIISIVPKLYTSHTNFYKKYDWSSSFATRTKRGKYGLEYTSYSAIIETKNNEKVEIEFGKTDKAFEGHIDLESGECNLSSSTPRNFIFITNWTENDKDVGLIFNVEKRTVSLSKFDNNSDIEYIPFGVEVPFNTVDDIEEVLFRISLVHDLVLKSSTDIMGNIEVLDEFYKVAPKNKIYLNFEDNVAEFCSISKSLHIPEF